MSTIITRVPPALRSRYGEYRISATDLHSAAEVLHKFAGHKLCFEAVTNEVGWFLLQRGFRPRRQFPLSGSTHSVTEPLRKLRPDQRANPPPPVAFFIPQETPASEYDRKAEETPIAMVNF